MNQPGFFRFNRRNRWLFYLVLMAIALLFSMQQKKGADQPSDQPPAISITAQDLARQYAADPAQAKKRFHKQRLEVTGVVFESGAALGKGYVKFATGENESLVRFFASGEQKEWVTGLSPGEQVTVTGVCQGYIAGVVVLE